jgi:hypothetical protein
MKDVSWSGCEQKRKSTKPKQTPKAKSSAPPGQPSYSGPMTRARTRAAKS